ncbi:MAG: hypothetical protein US35_C0002G0037 [Parcubacteria group bacterium GW2011_GWA2_37_10]|nr:MAG: hypothetical protein US35_C0002G0037 [Parcubacteria group bacterium GW2011_GWA2_37_10]
MQKYTPRNVQKGNARYKLLADKSVNRFQQNAARLEHSNTRNKNKSKKG